MINALCEKVFNENFQWTKYVVMVIASEWNSVYEEWISEKLG